MTSSRLLKGAMNCCIERGIIHLREELKVVAKEVQGVARESDVSVVGEQLVTCLHLT